MLSHQVPPLKAPLPSGASLQTKPSRDGPPVDFVYKFLILLYSYKDQSNGKQESYNLIFKCSPFLVPMLPSLFFPLGINFHFPFQHFYCFSLKRYRLLILKHLLHTYNMFCYHPSQISPVTLPRSISHFHTTS